MNVTSIAQIAGLIGEAGRIQMLTRLLDGKRHSALELAMASEVSPQTASSHLSKLLTGGFDKVFWISCGELRQCASR